MIKNKKIFIIGGAGFIGTALTTRLIANNKIVIFDLLKRNSLQYTDLLKNPNLTLIKGDILNKKQLEKRLEGCDIVIHLAAVAGVDNVITHPIETLKTNVIGTYNVLESCIKTTKIEKFINFSTSEVYGSYNYKINEDSLTIGPGNVGEARWVYANSKLIGEHFCFSYYKKFNLPVVSIRPFNIYGPGQVGEGAIHTFITRALKNEDIQIYGDGDQIRSWCYIDDLVDAVVSCLEKEEAVGKIFNVGNPRSTITILSLAEKIIELCNSKSKIVFVPKPYTDVELRIPSIDTAKKILNFTPKINLEEGLRRTIEWYKSKPGV